MAKKVTDPAILSQLNGSSAESEAAPAVQAGAKAAGAPQSQPASSGAKKVTDPEVLNLLGSGEPPATPYGKVTPAGTYASELMSGVNNGIANLMSLPAMVGNGLFSIGPVVTNALTGSDFKNADYFPDPGKNAKNLMEMSGAIRPPIDDVGHKVARRVGEEIGASLPLGATKPVQTLVSAVGSGLGAATAEQIDPNNPWLQLAGQFGGAAATGVLAGAARRLATTVPKPNGATLTADDLEMLKNEAYKAVDSSGARYSQQGYGKLLSQMDAAVAGDNISPTRHPKAWSLLQDLKARASGQYGGGLTLTQLDQVRQEIRRDLLRSSDESERHFGDLMMDEVDDFIAKAGKGDIIAGDAETADETIRAARELNTRFRKTELIEDALRAADLKNAAANGDLNSAIRRAFNTIILNPKKAASYSEAELADMEKLVKSGDGSNLLRNIGKLSGDSGIKALLHGFLSTQLGPAYALVPLVGSGAKALAGGRIVKAADDLRGRVAAGAVPNGNTLRSPLVDPAALGATLIGGAANTIANENERTKGNTLTLNGTGPQPGTGPTGSRMGVL